jgi:hypothetical protein
MNHRRALGVLTLLIGAVAAWGAIGVYAQPACPYANIRLDTTQAVDVEAVCDAAQPWAEKGFRVLVFLTDHRPGGEEAWFDFLDQIEVAAGLRDASSFDVTGLAFEASTATDLSWAYSVTSGENLYDTKLDKDEQAISRIKSQMREEIAAGDPTAGFVQALGTAYEVNYPPPSPLIRAVPWVLGGIVVLGVVGTGGVVAVFVVVRGVRRARQQKALEQHRDALATRTSNLLLACDELLHGDGAEETVLYQLFAAYGGEQYKAMRKEVREWLRRSQAALRDAFDLHQKLKLSSPEQGDVEQQVHDWEMLYVTLVGSSERILTLTDDELRTLLDPTLTLDRKGPDVQLAEQLDGIRNKLVGMPLKVEFEAVDPAKADAEGILGYIDQVKAHIARLQEAAADAPALLDRARGERQTLGGELPSPFVLTEKQLLGKIDERLEQAASDLQREVFLRVAEEVDQVEKDLQIVRAFLAAMGAHHRRRSEIDAIVEQGYRPECLETDLQEIETDIKAVADEFAAGSYGDAVPWFAELEADAERTLERLHAWQEKQSQNTRALEQLREWAGRVDAYRTGEMRSAWDTLRTYPKANWAEAAGEMEEATHALAYLCDEVLARVAHLNATEGQGFVEAERLLSEAAADLTRTEGQLQSVVNCLSEVQTAEANIDKTLIQAEEALLRAEAFRDQEDAKVGPGVDQQIDQAREQLARARQLAQAREFIPAVELQAEAVRLATAAHAAASEQVQEINDLQTSLQKLAQSVAGKVSQCKSRVKNVAAAARKPETEKLVQQAVESLSTAKQERAAIADLEDEAWAEALRAAVAAYEKAKSRADRAFDQIRTDVEEYEGRRRDAEQAVRDARAAIRRAQQKVALASGQGRHMLQKAREILPQMPTGDEPRQVLADTWKQAREALAYAKRAESQASAASFPVSLPRSSIHFGPGSGRATGSRSHARGSSWSSSSRRTTTVGHSPASRRTSTRSSSSGTSRRSSSSGTSRRSSSSGTSRRPSSSGTSRRSSSGGSSSRSRSSGSSRRR